MVPSQVRPDAEKCPDQGWWNLRWAGFPVTAPWERAMLSQSMKSQDFTLINLWAFGRHQDSPKWHYVASVKGGYLVDQQDSVCHRVRLNRHMCRPDVRSDTPSDSPLDGSDWRCKADDNHWPLGRSIPTPTGVILSMPYPPRCLYLI